MASVNIVKGTKEQLVAFLVLNLWPSHFGLPLLLATILLSRKVHRHPTFINLCTGFILVGVASCLLLYAGKTTGPEPSKELCLFQASILYGFPAFASLLGFMLVLQMFLVVRASAQKQVIRGPQALRLWIMLATPYLALLISMAATIAVGVARPESVSRDRRFFYCSVDSGILSGTLAAAGALVLIATLALEIWTLVILFKNHKVNQGVLELSLPIRVMAFGLYVIIAISLSLLSVTSPESPIPDLVIASAATVIILIFGTQRDILRALCFWHKEPQLKFNQLSSAPVTGSHVSQKSKVSESV
ncbi:hypothetical protein MIND_00726400 [Mycena indigotica]|uniref:Uncharacterized protein n=1 Tax=Mycena indigotica TaxID=2126181 RepID=A0A8H6SLM9_9AGAR|nr:uncharacterized protein MIND_00726400 [Mycena indigotica]KAF7301609.1 hypothetical protein MIND_00726400 [Mycena indigotica]